MQLCMLGARDRHLDRTGVDAIERDVIQYDRAALRHRGEADHAAAPRSPGDPHRRLAVKFGNACRRLELGDHEFRIVDLRDDEDLGKLAGEQRVRGGLRHQLDAGVLATDLEAKWKARDRPFCTIKVAAGSRLLRTPGVGAYADLRGRIEPESAPCCGGDQQQYGRDEQPPKRAPARRFSLNLHGAALWLTILSNVS